jgi:aerobic-type carbon monoxide dehydrogenase small subunit (CoxS/CutS family)
MEHYSLKINGNVYETDAEPFESLLDVLREKLRLTGSKKGCDEGECGACTALLDGKPVLSCILLVSDVRDREVLTIEGLP